MTPHRLAQRPSNTDGSCPWAPASSRWAARAASTIFTTPVASSCAGPSIAFVRTTTVRPSDGVDHGAGDVAGEASAVPDQRALADLLAAEAEAVVLVAARDGPLRAVQPALGGVGEQGALAEHVRRGVAHQVARGRPEAGGRGQGGGVDGVDRDPLAEDVAAVAGGVLLVPVRVELGAGALQPERGEDGLAQVLGVRASGHRLDHQAHQPVADVGVLELLVRRQHVGAVVRGRHQGRAVGERPVEGPEVAVVGVADDAAAVREQLGHRPVADPGARQVGDVLGDRVVEPQPALLHQLHHGGGREGLGVRGDPEQVVGAQRLAGVVRAVGAGQPGRSVRGLDQHLARHRDRELDARHPQRAAAQRHPGVGVPSGLPDDLQLGGVEPVGGAVVRDRVGGRPRGVGTAAVGRVRGLLGHGAGP